MEPVIRNYRSVYQPGGAAARLISLDDNPATCTMTYSVIEPGKTSAHHIHPWEHEVYILEGSGVLVCDRKEYPIREGDGMFIPGNVDHYTLNNRSSGVIRRIEVNPLIASQHSGARRQGGTGTARDPPDRRADSRRRHHSGGTARDRHPRLRLRLGRRCPAVRFGCARRTS